MYLRLGGNRTPGSLRTTRVDENQEKGVINEHIYFGVDCKPWYHGQLCVPHGNSDGAQWLDVNIQPYPPSQNGQPIP